MFHPLIDKPIEFPKENWIEPLTLIPDPNVRHPMYNIWNKFIESGKLIDDDYYLFISDDDFFEPDFLKKLKNVKTDIVLVSMKRGDNSTPKGSASTLVPNPRRMRRSWIALEQLIIKGRLIKNERFLDWHNADGYLIGNLWRKYPHDIFTFKTDAHVWFNYLEPGRWNAL